MFSRFSQYSRCRNKWSSTKQVAVLHTRTLGTSRCTRPHYTTYDVVNLIRSFIFVVIVTGLLIIWIIALSQVKVRCQWGLQTRLRRRRHRCWGSCMPIMRRRTMRMRWSFVNRMMMVVVAVGVVCTGRRRRRNGRGTRKNVIYRHGSLGSQSTVSQPFHYRWWRGVLVKLWYANHWHNV